MYVEIILKITVKVNYSVCYDSYILKIVKSFKLYLLFFALYLKNLHLEIVLLLSLSR
jgi:hypothetical protein